MQDTDALEQTARRIAMECIVAHEDKHHKDPAKAQKVVKPSDVPENVWRDFLAVRKAKKAPLTPTALAGITREVGKAGISLTRALTICIERNWVGFRNDWDWRPTIAPVAKKIKLFPIPGKTCSKPGCKLPAVYKDTSGDYDHYYCFSDMPDVVKERYE